MAFSFPFCWRPRKVYPSLEALPPAVGWLEKKDVTRAVTGGAVTPAPLIVAELARGRIIGDLRLVATRENAVIGGLQTIFGCADPGSHYALHRRRFRLPRRWRGTALLLGAANSDNYYHWLFESLPRWKMLQAAGYHDYDFILLHSQPRSFQDETLDWLGVPAAKRLRCSKNFVHDFDRLVVPAMPFPPEEVQSWVCAWLRSLAPASAGGPERVFFTRRGFSNSRQLLNEAELAAALADRGFVSIEPGSLSVAEQVRLLSAVRYVVAAHGAALSNLVFAPPGARLLEVFHPRHKNRCYFNLAAVCGHHYASLDGQALPTASPKELAYTVNVAAVLQVLDRDFGLAQEQA